MTSDDWRFVPFYLSWIVIHAVYVTPIALTAELLHVIYATDGCITHARTYQTRSFSSWRRHHCLTFVIAVFTGMNRFTALPMPYSAFQEQNVSDMDITNLSMEVVHPFKNPSTNSVTTFLSVDKLYELASTQTLTYTCIPPGVKQNVYFVIDDTINRQRCLLKKCSEYPDDCSAWRQGGNSTKPAYFIRSAQNSLHFVTMAKCLRVSLFP